MDFYLPFLPFCFYFPQDGLCSSTQVDVECLKTLPGSATCKPLTRSRSAHRKILGFFFFLFFFFFKENSYSF